MLKLMWTIWVGLTVAGGGWLLLALPGRGPARSASLTFLPGETTHGHHQIEMRCNVCHLPDGGVTDKSCIDCHGADLKQSRDTHPKSKFIDPTKAVLLQHIDAQNCLTCHVEHQKERTHAMGVTVPDDFCFHCHQNVAQDRPSHRGFAFNTCATAGCHNYHDNTALYENFLDRGAGEPKTHALAVNPLRKLQRSLSDHAEITDKRLTATQADAPPPLRDRVATEAWAASPHALAGVNCSGCHRSQGTDLAAAGQRPDAKADLSTWVNVPTHDACSTCHDQEVDGFLAGKHGMRLAAGLPPMSPRWARLPMHASAGHRSLDCSACHAAHNPDVRFAAYEACVSCHNDEHSRAYAGSTHFQLWQSELSGDAPPGAGVTCATCHMPRDADGRVQHNQSLNLRPNEKMIRTVCTNCHGLPFTLDALADPQLQANCYSTTPTSTVKSLPMAVEWFASKRKNK